MRKQLFRWLGRDFISFSAEAQPRASSAEQTEDLFRRADAELKFSGLSMEHTARVRIWGVDKEARIAGTAARAGILTGRSKAATSSYVSAVRFDSGAKTALDLLAMAPAGPGARRQVVEFEPARNYLRFLRYDDILFLSGFTSEKDTLEAQVLQVFSDVNDTLAAAGAPRARIVQSAVFLHRNEDVETARAILMEASGLGSELFEFELVDGFARDKGLLEVEVTALAATERR